MAVFLILVIITVTVLASVWDYRAYKKLPRVILILLSGLMLAGFLAEPEWLPAGSSSEYALLTEGWENSDLNFTDFESVYSLENRAIAGESSKWLASPSFLKDHLPAGSRVDLFGFGTEENLPDGFYWRNKLAKPFPGIKLNRAPAETETGRDFEISLSLISPSGNDSVAVYRDGALLGFNRSDENGDVLISGRLDMPGPASYRFEWSYGDSLISEPWNIRGTDAGLLTFGALLYSPDFEINYLSGHFGSRGHSFLIRTRIGDERFRFDGINAPQPGKQTIRDLFNELDLLILDPREYHELPEAEKENLVNAMERGLDVLLTTPASEHIEEWYEAFRELSGKDFEVETVDRLEERTWVPTAADNTPAELVRINLLNAGFSGLPDESEILGIWSGAEPVSLRLKRQNGSVSGQLFYQTYRWILAGHETVYNRFWTGYLENIMTLEADRIDTSPVIPRKNREMIITATTDAYGPEIRLIAIQSGDSLSVPLHLTGEHPSGSFARFWPSVSGWHKAEYGETERWFYVYEGEWNFDERMNRYRSVGEQITNSELMNEIDGYAEQRKVPDWIWLYMFLILQCILWAERKF